jgi:hypothetical protein
LSELDLVCCSAALYNLGLHEVYGPLHGTYLCPLAALWLLCLLLLPAHACTHPLPTLPNPCFVYMVICLLMPPLHLGAMDSWIIVRKSRPRYIYIYRERERERDREIERDTPAHISLSLSLYIYIYRERERET